MRATLPLTTPLRVSTSATWPMRMSLVWVSAIRSSAFSFVGSATRARLVPGARPAGRRSTGSDLQHAGHAGLDLEVVELPQAEIVGGAALIDVGFLRRELRLHAGRRHLEPLLGDRELVLQVLLAGRAYCFN